LPRRHAVPGPELSTVSGLFGSVHQPLRKISMKTSTFLPSLIFVSIFGLAAVVCAQTPPSADPCACGPGRNPKVDAALKACESELGGTPGHPVARELIDKCMEAKGFKRPPGPPPGSGNPPPPPPTSGS